MSGQALGQAAQGGRRVIALEGAWKMSRCGTLGQCLMVMDVLGRKLDLVTLKSLFQP